MGRLDSKGPTHFSQEKEGGGGAVCCYGDWEGVVGEGPHSAGRLTDLSLQTARLVAILYRQSAFLK